MSGEREKGAKNTAESSSNLFENDNFKRATGVEPKNLVIYFTILMGRQMLSLFLAHSFVCVYQWVNV